MPFNGLLTRKKAEKLIASQEPFAAAMLVPKLATANPTAARATAQQLGHLLATMTVPTWLRHVEQVRREYFDDDYRPLFRLAGDRSYWDKTGFPALRRLGRDAIPVLGIISFSPSGYVRQSAVQELARFREGEELPFLILRLNDWVSAVEEVARGAVLERLDPHHLPVLMAHITLLAAMERWRRNDFGVIITQVESLLTRPDLQQAVLQEIHRSSEQNRGPLLRHLLRIRHVSPEVIGEALQSADPTVQMRALDALARLPHPERFADEVQRLARNPRPGIRRRALQAATPRGLEDLTAILESSAMAISPSLRRTARTLLDTLSPRNWGEHYRQQLLWTDAERRAAVLEGLGECGTPADAALVRVSPVRLARLY